jgi:hypothetical protein
MSNQTFGTKFILPRPIQVGQKAYDRAATYMKYQGLNNVIMDTTAKLTEARSSREAKINKFSAMKDGGYDLTSLYWALGISVALFLFVTVIRNR